MGAVYTLAVRLQAHCKLPGCLVQSSGSCSPLERGMPATAFVRGPRSSAPTPCPTTSTWPSSLAHFPAASQKQGSMRPENGAAQARDAHLARIPEPFGAIEAASLRNDGRYHHAVDLGSWMCFQASSAGPSAYCFAFSRKEGMSSKHCRAGPSRCSPARSGRVGLPLPRWLLPEVNSRSYAPRLRRVGVLRIEVGTRWPFYLDPRHNNLKRHAR